MPKTRTFLIDAHALCYRSFYAIKQLATTKGQATNAVYGFVSTLRKLLREFNPDYVAVCFDSKEKTLRQEKFSEYKIQRPKMPDELISQIPIIKEAVRAFNLMIFESPGYEADDLIATLAHKFSARNIDVVIASDDKDMYQLASEQVTFYSSKKDMIIDQNDLKEKLGFAPGQITDFLALAGDSSDNIPGVAGVGEVTARNLILQFGTIEKMFQGLGEIKNEKLREKIKDQMDIARLSKELTILDRNVSLKFDLADLKVQPPDQKKLYELFCDLEFKKLAEEYAQGELSDGTVLDLENLQSKDLGWLLKDITSYGKFGFFPLAAAEGSEDQPCFIVVVPSKDALKINESDLKGLKSVFEDDKILKITSDIKEQYKILLRSGMDLKGDVFDVCLAAYVLMPSRGFVEIKDLLWNYCKGDTRLSSSAGKNLSLIFELADKMLAELTEKNLDVLLRTIEIPLSFVLAKMEMTGVRIDVDLLKDLSLECQKRIHSLTKRLYEISGEEFNLNSPKQLSVILFEKLKLPVIKKTKTGLSTDEEVLTILAVDHEFPKLILEYRQLAKLKSTYIDALPELINMGTNRIHAQFLQSGAETGRLSSRHPNLQNIPIRTDLGSQIRKAFVPLEKDQQIISADYSQIELRILAHLSNDENLKKAFELDQDIHRYTASLMFDISEKEVTDQMRDSAKRVNFGIIYGMSAFGLSKDLKITQRQAQDFIDRYFLRYPKVKTFMDAQIKECEKNGFVLTVLNRRRYIPEINSPNVGVRQFAQRQAINTPVQGSAADMIKVAMISIQNEIEKSNYLSRMIITVHDELVFSVPQKEINVMKKMIVEKMTQAVELSVPVKVDIAGGNNWLETEDL